MLYSLQPFLTGNLRLTILKKKLSLFSFLFFLLLLCDHIRIPSSFVSDQTFAREKVFWFGSNRSSLEHLSVIGLTRLPIGEDAQSVGFHARHTLTALNDRRLNESRCKWRELTTQDTRERGGDRRILNSKFLDYRCSICSTSLASRHVAAIGFPPLKYVVCGDVKVRDECVACVIPT